MVIDDGNERKVMEIAREYMRALESGCRPSHEDLVNQHPELRDPILECLEGIDLAFELQIKSRRSKSESTSDLDRNLAEPLGDFRIVREIGRGGMGVVYEALQLSLARPVALKVLPFAAALDERHRKRFLLEAQSAAQLQHPHIVPVYAVGCERGTYYYAMQLIDGRPISDSIAQESNGELNPAIDRRVNSTIMAKRDRTIVKSGSRPWSHSRDRFRSIAAFIVQAADALEYAHSCGIVHRDVKPGNLLLDIHGKVWITDFGLAQITTNEQITQTDDLLGTLRYMSPEQASGTRGVLDHRSDVYSLGATLYELLAGRPVFDGRNRQELLQAILNEEPRSLRKINRLIPEELDVIVLKALRHLPSDRYQSAQAFADDLRRFLSETPILARRPTSIEIARKWMRRHPATVLSILFSLVAAVLSLAIVTVTVTHQKSLTDASLQREQHRAFQAEKRLAIAQAAADEMIRMAESELSINPMEEALRQRLLTSAIQYYNSLIAETTENTELQTRLMATRHRAEGILQELSFVQSDRQNRLLFDSRIQKELALTDEQIAKLGTLPIGAHQPGDAPYLEEAKIRLALTEAILTASQKERLKGLFLQHQGPPGLRDMVVTGKLKLTPEQMRSVQTDLVQYFATHRGSFPLGDPMSVAAPANGKTPTASEFVGAANSPDDLMSPQLKEALMKILLKRLTPEQRKQWDELTGVETEFEAPVETESVDPSSSQQELRPPSSNDSR
jgi:eukaryotic-like serine/threonine-protein kinase